MNHFNLTLACSGIDAGANLSGDLQDPVTAIPKGTLMAVMITYGSYILMGVLSAGCSLRYASGSIPGGNVIKTFFFVNDSEVK
jgi:amino acid transporter